MEHNTPHARAAQAVRAALKERFPGQKFSVRADSYAGGNAVRVRWVDGPTSEEVDSVVCQFQMGHFDGMRDIYEITNRRHDIPQVSFVTTQREFSDAAVEEAVDFVNRLWGCTLRLVEGPDGSKQFDAASHRMPGPCGQGWMTHEVYRRLQAQSFGR